MTNRTLLSSYTLIHFQESLGVSNSIFISRIGDQMLKLLVGLLFTVLLPEFPYPDI